MTNTTNLTGCCAHNNTNKLTVLMYSELTHAVNIRQVAKRHNDRGGQPMAMERKGKGCCLYKIGHLSMWETGVFTSCI